MANRDSTSMGSRLRFRFVPPGLIVLGSALVIAWCVLVLPALFVAESGAGLTRSERAMLAAPLALAGVLLVTGGRLAGRPASGTARVGRHVAVSAVLLLGVATCAAAVLVLFLPS